MKSGNRIVSSRKAVWESLVPITAKFRPLALTALRLLIVSVLLSPGAIEVGLNAQLAAALPEQVRLMLPVKPNWVVAVMVKVVESVPRATLAVLVGDESEKAATPPPRSGTTCGLPAASSVMVSVPVRVPVAVGVKVTLISQLAPAATEAPQVLVSAKSPLTATLLMVNGALPVFVRVTVCGALVMPMPWLLKLRPVRERNTRGATPMPPRETTRGLPVASSVTVMVPIRAPMTVGVKVTSMAQFAPAATALPQVFVCAKSPVISMLVMAKAASPAFVSVMVSGVLVAATA